MQVQSVYKSEACKFFWSTNISIYLMSGEKWEKHSIILAGIGNIWSRQNTSRAFTSSTWLSADHQQRHSTHTKHKLEKLPIGQQAKTYTKRLLVRPQSGCRCFSKKSLCFLQALQQSLLLQGLHYSQDPHLCKKKVPVYQASITL